MSWVQKLHNKILCQLLRNRRYYYLQLMFSFLIILLQWFIDSPTLGYARHSLLKYEFIFMSAAKLIAYIESIYLAYHQLINCHQCCMFFILTASLSTKQQQIRSFYYELWFVNIKLFSVSGLPSEYVQLYALKGMPHISKANLQKCLWNWTPGLGTLCIHFYQCEKAVLNTKKLSLRTGWDTLYTSFHSVW
jgi:hypothetical protein